MYTLTLNDQSNVPVRLLSDVDNFLRIDAAAMRKEKRSESLLTLDADVL